MTTIEHTTDLVGSETTCKELAKHPSSECWTTAP